MIKKLTLTNFESHKNTILDFSQGVNIIVGESEQGKSSILRAIEWVVTNRPTGDAFRSHWGGETSVELEMDDCLVKRIKGKENKYTLQMLDDVKPTEFKAFGTNVPIEITKALNINPINIQTQFEEHFLLPPVSPGEVARQINQYVDLEVIDRSAFNINSTIRGLERDIANIKIGVQTLEIDIQEKYANLEDAEKLLNKLEQLELRTTNIRENYLNLDEIITELIKTKEEEKTFVYIKQAEEKLLGLLAILEKIKEAKTTKTKLEDCIVSCEKVDKNLKKYTNIDKKKLLFGILNHNMICISEMEMDYEKIMNIVNSINAINMKIKVFSKNILEKESKFKTLFPKQCPLCGQEIK